MSETQAHIAALCERLWGYSDTAPVISRQSMDMDAAAGVIVRQHEEIDRLERRVRVLEEALKPFAMVAAHDIGNDETDRDAFRPFSNPQWAVAPLLTVGDLRRARDAIIATGDK